MGINTVSVDIVVDWISQREASYIAKYDKIVWFASITGRPMDAKWQELTLAQAKRVISATIAVVSEVEIITAFQELGEVDELAVESEATVPDSVFNYTRQSFDPVESLVEDLITQLSLVKQSIPISQFNYLYQKELYRRGVPEVSTIKRNRVLAKVINRLSWVLLKDKNRVSVSGLKTTVLRKANYLGKVGVWSTTELDLVLSVLVLK